MWKKAGTIALLMVFVIAAVSAEDINAQPSPEELQQMIAELRAEVQQARAQVITVHIDQDTQRLLQVLEDKIIAMEQKLGKIEERFLTLRNELIDKIDTSHENTISEIESRTNKKINETAAETRETMRMLTNPIRINLPNFGLWMMLTAAFMLFAGLRYKGMVAAAKHEKKKREDSK